MKRRLYLLAIFFLGLSLLCSLVGLAGDTRTAAAGALPSEVLPPPAGDLGQPVAVTDATAPAALALESPALASAPAETQAPESTTPTSTVAGASLATEPVVQPATETALPAVTPTPDASLGQGIAAAPADGAGYESDRVLVKFKVNHSLADVQAIALPLQAQVESELAGLGVWNFKVTPGQVPAVILALQQNPEVEFVEPAYLAQTYLIPDDPDWPQQSYLWNVQAPQAWDVTIGSAEIVVAIIDTGLDVSHPELASQIWNNPGEIGVDSAGRDKRANGVDDDSDGYVDDWLGWNTAAGTNNVQDDNGHGTHLAGIVAAQGNNGQGIAGVAWGARLMPLKAMDATGVGSYLSVAEGILFAVDHGARVVNLSLGSPAFSKTLESAVQYALDRNVVVVAAAGDSGSAQVNYPAAYPGVIGVGATDLANQRAPFSTFGETIDLVAPGVDVYSTYPGGQYSQMSGTSMAAVHVSAAAALLASLPQFDTAAKIQSALLASALDLGPTGPDPEYGHGLLQSRAAFDQIPPNSPTPPATSTPVFTPTPTLLPSPTPTATPWIEPTGDLIILATQGLWGTAQSCSYTITNAANSLDLAFNNATASCSGAFGNGGSWTYTAIQDTTLTAVVQTSLDFRFYQSGWIDDQIDLEVSRDNGNTWTRIARFQTGSPPPAALTTLSFDVSSLFVTPSQVNAARVRLRGTQVNGAAEAITIYLDEARLNPSDTFGPVPTPTAPAPAPTSTPAGPQDPHVNYSAMTDSCGACHRSHSASGIVLRQAWPEESLCLGCHQAAGPGVNVQPAFTSYTNTLTRFFKHDVAAVNGVHRPGQASGAQFGGANRHVECEDCHEPHEATRGPAIAPMLQRVMNFVSGVDPAWTGAGAPVSFTWLPQAGREYQVCFKCHSGFTTLPTYAPDGWNGSAYVADGLRKLTSANAAQVRDSRDLAREFNPYNASFHPVVAIGRNQSIPAGSWAAGSGMSSTSLIYCASCHNNPNSGTQRLGPHGSPLLHLLLGANGGQSNYATVFAGGVQPANQSLCFRCHDYATYVNNGSAANTNFRVGGKNLHDTHARSFGGTCYMCHDTHGSEQQHLINFDASTSNGVTFYNGTNSQTAWTGNGCSLQCHGKDHRGITYP